MNNLILKLYETIGAFYLKPLLKAEQRKRPFPVINERATEYTFAFKHLSHLCTGPVLDVGPGKSSWPHLLSTCGFEVTAIDKIQGYWSRYFNRHYGIVNDDITHPQTHKKFQFVTCLSVLEHIPDHMPAMINMHDLLQKGGYLILTFPYNEVRYHEDIYKHPDAGYGKGANFITQVYARHQIDSWLEATSFRILDQEYYQAFTGEFWTMGDRLIPCKKVSATEKHHLTCILLQKDT